MMYKIWTTFPIESPTASASLIDTRCFCMYEKSHKVRIHCDFGPSDFGPSGPSGFLISGF